VSHFLGEYFHPYALPLCFKGQGERGRIGIGPNFQSKSKFPGSSVGFPRLINLHF